MADGRKRKSPRARPKPPTKQPESWIIAPVITWRDTGYPPSAAETIPRPWVYPSRTIPDS